ncbi:hypothetical protein Lesp02_54470 [Lentzea sp. NBRC 105346]|uniref:hypothetical protein n=1 Tax=Lentzea sp. NBRC 105346 TaxID=3032205 RepID=UPI0024A39F43|nr:hypothetical protein [Lentzea sp. NBRC 105346]GLZ33259.1 hypothetical protein Lesp02_54470 [Lentzea sp. NBRC 105346]
MDHEDFVTAVAREVVTSVAPDELALFEPIRGAYLRDPDKLLAQRGRAGEVLGSGIDVAIALVSPVALAVATATYNRLVDRTGEAVVNVGSKLWKRLRRKEELPEITAEQLGELHAMAFERAKELGLSEEQAKQVADALRAQLTHEN